MDQTFDIEVTADITLRDVTIPAHTLDVERATEDALGGIVIVGIPAALSDVETDVTARVKFEMELTPDDVQTSLQALVEERVMDETRGSAMSFSVHDIETTVRSGPTGWGTVLSAFGYDEDEAIAFFGQLAVNGLAIVEQG